ncbi:AIG2-like protein D [Typha latifolia]|uniref:AIG2-like protein D n=1 Tax=Typha latifolia TaxID=4733 RepID=UPI003C2E340D
MASSTSSPSLPLHNVFVYGSLLADEVVHVLLNRLPPSSPAILNGYHRFSIKGRVYPAILPVDSKKVAGKVITGITDLELDILDTFEDVEYIRRTVEISLPDKSEKLFADTYVWGNKDDPNLYGDWDFEEWKQLHMKDFLNMTKGFMEELEQPESKTRVATYESFFQQD